MLTYVVFHSASLYGVLLLPLTVVCFRETLGVIGRLSDVAYYDGLGTTGGEVSP